MMRRMTVATSVALDSHTVAQNPLYKLSTGRCREFATHLLCMAGCVWALGRDHAVDMARLRRSGPGQQKRLPLFCHLYTLKIKACRQKMAEC